MTHPPLPMVFDFLVGGFVSPLEHVAVTGSARQKQSVFVLLGLRQSEVEPVWPRMILSSAY